MIYSFFKIITELFTNKYLFLFLEESLFHISIKIILIWYVNKFPFQFLINTQTKNENIVLLILANTFSTLLF